MSQLSTLIGDLRAHLDDLEELSQQHPEISSADMLQPVATEIARTIRQKVWDIFSESAAFIGRNSVEAVKADARLTVMRIFSGDAPLFVTKRGRGNDSKPKEFIDAHIAPTFDLDQVKYVYSFDLYSFLNKKASQHPLYKALYKVSEE